MFNFRLVTTSIIFGVVLLASPLWGKSKPTVGDKKYTAEISWAPYSGGFCKDPSTFLEGHDCALSLNIMVFKSDGTVQVAANGLDPHVHEITSRLKQGEYSVWVVVTGYSRGSFVVSDPKTVTIFITPEGKLVIKAKNE